MCMQGGKIRFDIMHRMLDIKKGKQPQKGGRYENRINSINNTFAISSSFAEPKLLTVQLE